jgi:nitrogenase-associated protein
MAKIVFFEKTGCINNTKQKKILTMAGHDVEAVNLLKYPWSKTELLSFFSELEPADCFNRSAPAVVSGQVFPHDYSKAEAVEAMLIDRLLIKRPLLIIENQKFVGFDKEKLDALIGLATKDKPEIMDLLNQNLDDCPQKSNGYTCD